MKKLTQQAFYLFFSVIIQLLFACLTMKYQFWWMKVIIWVKWCYWRSNDFKFHVRLKIKYVYVNFKIDFLLLVMDRYYMFNLFEIIELWTCLKFIKKEWANCLYFGILVKALLLWQGVVNEVKNEMVETAAATETVNCSHHGGLLSLRLVCYFFLFYRF